MLSRAFRPISNSGNKKEYNLILMIKHESKINNFICLWENTAWMSLQPKLTNYYIKLVSSKLFLI